MIISTLALFTLFGVASAQKIETLVTTVTSPKGEQEVTVEYRQRAVEFQYDSFQSADLNGDGCVDANEAKLKGILDFNEYAKQNPRCLNEYEYNAAMRGEPLNAPPLQLENQ